MKVYLKSGKSIRITQGIANDLWTALDENDDAAKRYFRIAHKNTGDTYIIIPINEISCVK